ncbi:ABC transporter permease [Streptosporangium sp. KLBMP 9127]|nr:FtsX-like permease family protein [Streptosporangium sp. KLBMP 9127]
MRGRAPLLLQRAFSEPLLLLAAFGSILLATTTLVALTMYASSVVDVGVRRAMETALPSIVSATVTSPVSKETFPTFDRSIRDRLTGAYAGLPTTLTVSSRSDSYAMPGQAKRKTPELTRFGVYEGLEGHARLQSGAWARPAGPTGTTTGTTTGTVEAVLSQPAARAMGLSTGSEITIEGRLDHAPVRVKITGIYTLNDPNGDRWTAEGLLSRGVERGNFTTYGPLMVPLDTFAGRFTTDVSVSWIAEPDLRALAPDRMDELATTLGSAMANLPGQAGCGDCTARTRLPDMLAQLDTAGTVARSTMLVPVLQLLLLAAYALMLTARLLADHRRMEVALLRSRGAGSVRLAALAAGEALLIALPCALAAPFLAAPLLRLVASIPWIETSGVRLAPNADLAGFVVSGLVALGCAVLLSLPALRGARRTYVEEQSARGRGDRKGLAQRAGADLAVLGVAALAIWQLRSYGAPVTATAGGELGIDPLIITGPALALLCGGMLGLRLVSPISRLAERITSKRTGLAPALGAWQVSRRPLRYSGPALLLTMAIAIGVLSLATATTWRASQEDQARHRAGADLRVAGPVEGHELGPLGRGTAYAALPGVESLSPAYRAGGEFGDNEVTLLALDAGKVGGLAGLRPDLAADSLSTIADRLVAGRPALPALPLPGEPAELTVDLRLTVEEADAAAPYEKMPVRMLLQDGLGVRWETRIGPLERGANEVRVDLASLSGRSGRITYPLSVRGFSLEVPVPVHGSAFTFAVERIRTGDGPELAQPAGVRWAHRLPSRPDVLPAAELGESGLFSVAIGRSPTSVEGVDPQILTVLPAPAEQGDDELFAPPTAPQAKIFGALPVVITKELAASENLAVGQVAMVTMERTPTRISVAGILDALPGTTSDQPAVLADWETLQTRELASGRSPRTVTEWWIGTRGGDTAPAAAELKRRPEWDQTVVDLKALGRELRDDPLASGLQGALVLGFVAALAFALLGFVVNAAVAARERMAEFAILRALGVSSRQILGLLTVEQTFLIGLSLASGTVLAVVVASLVVPHIVLTGQATSVTPDVLLDIPWPATAGLLVVVAAALFGIVAVLARNLRGHGLDRALRIGDDR